MLRRSLVLGALVAAAIAPSSPPATAQDIKAEVPVIRVGILGGENEADRLTNFSCWKAILETEFGVPVELYPAADYAGVMQGLIAKQLDVAGLGAAGYAGIYTQDPNAVEPIATTEQTDGSTGYYSVMIVRADSGIQNLGQLKGKSLAFADPNSTSGYLVPEFQLTEMGMKPEEYFGRTGFAGGHEQAVVALLNGQYDAAATWASGIGEESQGYSSGNLRKMVDKGALKMSDIRVVWKSALIPNGPEVIRKDLPEAFKTKYVELLMGLPERDPACFQATQGGEFTKFVPITVQAYEPIIKMSQEQDAGRRG